MQLNWVLVSVFKRQKRNLNYSRINRVKTRNILYRIVTIVPFLNCPQGVHMVSTCIKDNENNIWINVFWPTVNAWVMFVSGRTNATKYMAFLCHIWHFEAISDCYDSAILPKLRKKSHFLGYFMNLFILCQIYRKSKVENADFYQNSRWKSFMNIFCNIATFYIILL